MTFQYIKKCPPHLSIHPFFSINWMIITNLILNQLSSDSPLCLNRPGVFPTTTWRNVMFWTFYLHQSFMMAMSATRLTNVLRCSTAWTFWQHKMLSKFWLRCIHERSAGCQLESTAYTGAGRPEVVSISQFENDVIMETVVWVCSLW